MNIWKNRNLIQIFINGGHKIKTKRKAKLLDPENIERIENDVSFNYAQTDFKFEEQPN